MKKQLFYLFIENLKISFASIKSNKLRSIITIFIIAFGITALIGIITAIDAIKFSLNSNFSKMGANSFEIKSILFQSRGEMSNNPNISYKEAINFKENFVFPATVSINSTLSSTATVTYESEKSNPNISVIGTDENYLNITGTNLYAGRNFSINEIINGKNVAIIGKNVIDKIFTNNTDPLNKEIKISHNKYKVIGCIEKKGATIGFSNDNSVFIPLENARKKTNRSLNYTTMVNVHNTEIIDNAINEATQVFRNIRKLKPGEDNNFEISKSNSLAKMLIENIQYVTLAATIIGFITLLGAAIGLMNIMLVSVTERTKEIGTRKAIGGSANRIKIQFLIESILIGQIGGVLGIFLGIIVGNTISFFIKTPFIIPWAWIFTGIILCGVVSVVSGWYPAKKASNLDPIEALRHE